MGVVMRMSDFFLDPPLDGNEDGLPDDKHVITQLERHRSALLIFSGKGMFINS